MTAGKLQARIERVIQAVADDGQTSFKSDYSRLRYLRPSSFSYCPLHTFLSLKKQLRPQQPQNFSSAFFTKVGSAAHEAWQDSTLSVFGGDGQNGVKLLRDWVCTNPSCSHRHQLLSTAPTECEKCSHNKFRTAEHQVNRQGIRGHVDEILIFADTGTAIPIDWKSCSTAKLQRKKLGSDPAYEAQISTYATLLRRPLYKLGYRVEGWALCYFTRDNPFKRCVVFGDRFMGVHQLREWRDQHQAVLHLNSSRKVDQLVADRPCKTRATAQREHPYCPFSLSCTHSDFEARAYARDVFLTLDREGKIPAIDWINSQTHG